MNNVYINHALQSTNALTARACLQGASSKGLSTTTKGAECEFKDMVDVSGSGRIQGKAIQDQFAQPLYGWTKDATRYMFAALFRAGEIQLHTGEGTVTTPGPQAVDAFKSTVAFNRAGVSRRDGRPPLDAMDRAARRLEELFAIEVLPLEEHISRAVRTHMPTVIEEVGSLPIGCVCCICLAQTVPSNSCKCAPTS